MTRPLVIGFTGQIGSGKSTAGGYFADLGVPVIDTDQLAREAVAPRSEAYRKIITHFGPAVVSADNSLDRKALRTLIFNDAEAKLWLEQLLHPIIEERLQQQLQACHTPYVVVLIPLLLDRPQLKAIDRILVIDSDHVQQRVLQRDAIDLPLLQKILECQPTREQLRAAAADLLINNGSLTSLRQQVTDLHHSYLRDCRQ